MPADEPVKVRVARAFDALRTARSLSLSTVADRTTLPPLTVRALAGLRTTKQLPLAHVHRLAQVLDVHLADLLHGTEASWSPWNTAHDDAGAVRRHIEQALKAARAEAGLTTRAVASEGDFDHSYVTRLEGGLYETLDLVRAERFAWACGVDLIGLLPDGQTRTRERSDRT